MSKEESKSQPVGVKIVEVPKKGSSLGKAAVVLGIIALAMTPMPLVNVYGMYLALIGALLAVIGFFLSLFRKMRGIGTIIGGFLLCSIAMGATVSVYESLGVVGDTEAANQEIVESGDDSSLGTTNVTSTNPHTREKANQDDSDYAPAREAVRQGNIEVRIVDYRIEPVRLVSDVDGSGSHSQEDLMWIKVEVTNRNENKKIDIEPWYSKSGLTIGGAVLRDNFGNDYRRVTFGIFDRPAGASKDTAIYPGKTFMDVLVFERPVDTAQYVLLTLPAKNFNGSGVLKFRITLIAIKQ